MYKTPPKRPSAPHLAKDLSRNCSSLLTCQINGKKGISYKQHLNYSWGSHVVLFVVGDVLEGFLR